MEKGPKMTPAVSETPKDKESSETQLEKRGWTAEMLKAAQELVLKLAETGHAVVDAMQARSISPDGIDLDQTKTTKIEMLFSKKAQGALKVAATALTAGGAILAASPAFAEIQKDTITETGDIVKTFPILPGTQQFEVLAGSDTLDIGPVRGFEKKTIDGRTVYQPDGSLTAPATLSIKLNVPADKKGTELIVKSKTSHDNDLQLFEGAGGNIRWMIGDNASQSTGLDALAGIEGSLASHKESSAEKTSGWRMPVGLRIMQGQPDKNTPVTLGLTTGLALWNSDLGEIKGEVGATFDPKTLKGALGHEALFALSYTRKMGKLEINASSLSTLGSEGKTAADIGVDLEIKRFKTPGGDISLSSGLGMSMSEWNAGKGNAEKSLLHIRPVKVSFPFLGNEVSLSPSITKDIYRGDTGGAVDLSIRPGK